MQNRTPRRKRENPAPEGKVDVKSDQMMASNSELSASAVLKALIMIQGLGILLHENVALIIDTYEDEEQHQHVIFATWDAEYGKSWGNLLLEVVFAGSEVVVRWFNELAGAHLPKTEEEKAIDCERCLALFKCVLYGYEKFKLPRRMLCMVDENLCWVDETGFGDSRYLVTFSLRKRGFLSFHLNSNLGIIKIGSQATGRGKVDSRIRWMPGETGS